MDRSLWVLMRLRFLALVRRWKKTLSRPKGIVLAVVTALVFVPWLFSIVMTVRLDVKPPLERIRRLAPLGLFAFTIASLLFSVGEQALYYSPAEVAFLFAGPYRKRQILAYKLFTTVMLCLVSSLFFTLMSSMVSPRLISAFVGSFLVILFLQMLQMVVGLAANTLGALAWSRGRRLILVGLVVLAGLAVVSVGRGLGGVGPLEALQRVERSAPIQAILTPFRWFVQAFTAERVFPDLIRGAALGLMVDVVLIGLVFALDASYLEAASASSAKRYAKLRRVTAGGGSVRSTGTRKMGRFRFRPPNPPWWGGVGPNFWRQMTGALGDPGRLIGVVVMLSATPIVMIAIVPKNPNSAESMPFVCMGMIAWMSIILSVLIPFDFRGDVDVMEELKSLPIPADRLALGQLLTPTLIATATQAIAMIAVIVGLGGPRFVAWWFLAFLLPVNFLFYAIENLLFLWYPSRVVAGQFDIMAVGRQVLMMLAKMIGLAVGSGLAALVGVIVYFAAGREPGRSLLAAWIALVAVALAILPLVGQAFRKFDVTTDIPA